MQLKITANGDLHIKRAGRWKQQGCPHCDYPRPCGDWCPKFREPKLLNGDPFLRLCDNTYFLHENGDLIVDEREEEE